MQDVATNLCTTPSRLLTSLRVGVVARVSQEKCACGQHTDLSRTSTIVWSSSGGGSV